MIIRRLEKWLQDKMCCVDMSERDKVKLINFWMTKAEAILDEKGDRLYK